MKGWEIVCPDGRVRGYPYHNYGDAACDARIKTERRKCRFYSKPSPLELSQPPCPLGEHTVRPCVFTPPAPPGEA